MPKNIMTILAEVRLGIACIIGTLFLFLNCNIKVETGGNIKPKQILKSTIFEEHLPEDFVEIIPAKNHIELKLVYATDSNFLNQKVYPCPRAFLRIAPFTALISAVDLAKKAGYELILFDAYRPKSIQKKMYDIVQNPDYVAHPDKGSKHNRGCAVDISLRDIHGELDMGTEFDDFSEKAHYNSKNITEKQKQNRKLLRDIMIEAGFVPYDKEWWHFNYKKTDYPVSDFIWTCSE